LHYNKVCTTTGTWQSVVVAIIREFVYRKVWAKWVLKVLTIEYKAAWEAFILKLNLFAPVKRALDAVLWLTMSWDTVYMKNSDMSAKIFMWFAYSVSCKGGKVCWYQGDFVEEINFAKDVPMIHVNFIVTVIIIAVKNGQYCHTTRCVYVCIFIHDILCSVGFLYI